MIPLNYEFGFFVFLVVWFVYLTILWIRETWRTKINTWSLSEGKLCICEDCRFAFLIKPQESMARCPRCGNLCYLKKKIMHKEL